VAHRAGALDLEAPAQLADARQVGDRVVNLFDPSGVGNTATPEAPPCRAGLNVQVPPGEVSTSGEDGTAPPGAG